MVEPMALYGELGCAIRETQDLLWCGVSQHEQKNCIDACCSSQRSDSFELDADPALQYHRGPRREGDLEARTVTSTRLYFGTYYIL